MNVEETRLVDRIGHVQEYYAHYVSIFREVDSLAINRHLMTYNEFSAVMQDQRIVKFFAYDGGILQGMSVVTNELEAWSLISPAYFKRRYPDQYGAMQVWYIGYVGALRKASPATFGALLAAMYEHVKDGISFMDFCSYNVDERNLASLSHLMMKRIDKTICTEKVDAQEFWMMSFPERNNH